MAFCSVSRLRGLLPALTVLFGLALLAAAAAPARAAYAPPYAAIVVDVKTGQVLHEDNADARRFPASLTKVMTLYMLFEQLEAGRLTLESPLRVSARAAAEPPSKLGLRPGTTISVENAILALVTRSANDVAAVVAENLGGSVENFARQMTQRARELGMSRTTFRNASGLPDQGQVTTARDLARLAVAVQDRFPQYYGYFSRRSFTFAGAAHANHNRLLGRVEGVDGIKTGFIRASGFNLMTNAQSNGRHIVVIVLGGRSGAHRDGIVTNLVERHLPRAFAGARRTPTIGSPAVAAAPARAPARAAVATLPPVRPADLGAPTVVAAAAAAPPAPLDLSRMRPAVATAAGAATVTPGSLREPPPGPIPPSASAFAAAPLPPAPIPEVQATASVTARAIETAAPATPLPPTPVREAVAEIAPAPAPAAPVAVASASPAAPLPPAPIPSAEQGSAAAAPEAPRYALSPWVIQIGAVDSEDAAFDMLQRAQSRLGAVLGEAAPFTEKIQSNGATLFRARFSGFEAAGEARDACRQLERSGFRCFAVRS